MSQSGATATTPTAAELLHTVDAHWQAWVEVVDGIPEDQLDAETCGFWTTRDLLGHVAFWEDWGAEAVRLSLAGEAIPDEAGDVNQVEVDKHKHDSVADLKRYRAEAHDRLMTSFRIPALLHLARLLAVGLLATAFTLTTRSTDIVAWVERVLTMLHVRPMTVFRVGLVSGLTTRSFEHLGVVAVRVLDAECAEAGVATL